MNKSLTIRSKLLALTLALAMLVTFMPAMAVYAGDEIDEGESTERAVTSWVDLYTGMGLTATAGEGLYDAVTSATNFTSTHAKDIPTPVHKVTAEDGTILSLDGVVVSDASTAKPAAVKSGEWSTYRKVFSKTGKMYGTDQLRLNLDPDCEGYDWSDFCKSLYAVTVSDGTTTVGALPWIDFYVQEKGHVNYVDLALNSSDCDVKNASNEAVVHRFDAFYDENKVLKSGTYTMTVYAQGYAPLSVDIVVPAMTIVEMQSVTIGGVNYFYKDTAAYADADDTTAYRATIRSRSGSTVYYYAKGDLTQVGETDYYYAVPTGTPLTGKLYGYGEGTATTYKAVYEELGVTADDSYDAITSATDFASRHAGDIPSLVTYGTDAEGKKAITGLTLNRASVVVTENAADYVEAKILDTAGADLSDEQKAMLAVTLKTNPTNPPAENVAVKLSSATYTTSKYGIGEFAIVPDDTVEGYVWSEYWSNVYAVTISNGTDTVGAVHWIDMYGEAATSGAHYNKVEIALNNGKSIGSNEATVNRFAPFFTDDPRAINNGTYTIKVYAEGYDTLEATVKVLDDEGKADEAIEAATAAVEEAQNKVVEAQAAVDALTEESTDAEVAAAYKKLAEASQAVATAQSELATANAAKAEAVANKLAAVKEQLEDANTQIAELTVVDISNYAVTLAGVEGYSATYTGKALTPAVNVAGVDATNYTVVYADNTNAGTATVTITATGEGYKGEIVKNFTINKKANTLTVKAKKPTAKAATLKKKAVTLAKAKVVTVSKDVGKVTYKKASGNAKIVVNAKTGNVTLKKGLKKGTYTVKIKVTAAGNDNVEAGAKTVTVTIKVK